ncbi:nucleoside hydrolase [Kaistia dalseonensis]|uniref:Purine nucleosidase n=1 Tax=Kaistia dalseonensis TaxID=410840 RepID=A0ABU0HAE8_9HYPH|nr:nucleoside hydrolase [Kaistia dalseonensis]MCX5496671.1 nucleoside hydrolase [Kaistia dalseonensis]MDQ0439295.1 purine nucleosidase [Kaistia dalseonensis]
MTETCRMILDVDTGIDDAMAIFYAIRRPGIKLEALTTTFGNTDTVIATENTLKILELLGRPEIPVAPGVGRSLIKPYKRMADHVHGSNGLGNVELPAPKIKAIDEHAIDLMIRMIKENPGEITLCPVGPITNVALALTKAPEIAKLVKEIVVMGSTIFHPGIHGPIPPMVDANFANDPEAAHIVVQSGANVTLVGMDVTMTTLLSTDMMAEISREGDHAAQVLMQITEFYVNSYKEMYPGIKGCGLHDPLAVAIAEDPTLATMERMYIDIELHGELTRGQTVADRRRTADHLRNCNVCMAIDRPRFEGDFMDLMKMKA